MLNSIFKSKSNISVVKLSSGNIIAQIIPFLLTPLLTRLYTPRDFGALAIFISITLILSEIVTGKYEMAILLPKKQSIAVRLAVVTIYISLFFSLFLLLLIVILKQTILDFLDPDDLLNSWIYLIPFAVFFNALYEIFKDFSLRVNAYNQISGSIISKSVVGSLSQLILGFLKFSSFGLIIGNFFSYIAANIQVFSVLKKEKIEFKKLQFKEYFPLLKHYKDFPLYSMPSAVLTTFSYQLMLIALPILFSGSIAGYYLLAQRILNIPVSLLGNSMKQVNFKEFSNSQNSLALLQKKAWDVFKKLVFIGSLPTFIMLFFGPLLFKIVFGKEWETAGTFAQILSLWYLTIFISGPISPILIVLRKQKQVLIFQIISIILKIGLLIVCFFNKYPIVTTLTLFSLLSGLLLTFYLIYILRSIKIDLKKVGVFSLLVLVVFSLIFYFLRALLAHFLN